MDGRLYRRLTATTREDAADDWSHWAAACRVDEAVAARGRQQSLEQQAAQESTMTGVLLDLGERGQPVTVRTVGGQICYVQIVRAGGDFVLVCDDNYDQLLIPTAAIATISTSPARRRVTGTRTSPSVVLADTLHELTADQAQVYVVVADECVRGLLKTAGTDVIAVTVDQPRDDQVHVATAAIDHLVVPAR